MSSANNKEYGELEQSMWRRFQDAEAMPDPEVWSRIDHELTLLENAKYKRRVLFYRQLAAACFTLFILAGSVLMLHFKQDKEKAMLATTGAANPTKTDTNTRIASKQTITEEQNSEAIVTDEEQGQDYTSGNNIGLPSIVQAPVGNYTYLDKESGYTSAGKETINNSKQNYNPGIDNPATIASQSGTFSSEQLATTSTGNITSRNTTAASSATVADVSVQEFVPASQAIASVPADYTSPSVLNPLLRRNATLGSIASEDKAGESITPQKQADLALALNTPTESNKEEKAATNNRWNVGMAYGSTYFNQNIAIPGYTIIPRVIQFGVVPDPNKKQDPKPAISGDSEINMRDARIEFKENTQAATSFNVDVKTGFRLGKRLKLLTGIGYSQNTSKTMTSYIVEQFLFKPRTNERFKLQPTTVFLPSLNTFTTDSVSVVKTKQPFDVDYSYQMLSIPLGLQVEGNMGQKWYWYAASSMAANFLMQTTIRASNPEIASVTYSAADDSPFRKVQFSGNMGAGIGKRLSNAINISFGPEFRTFFNSMLTDEKAVATQGRPYTIGVNMGINYMLGQDSE